MQKLYRIVSKCMLPKGSSDFLTQIKRYQRTTKKLLNNKYTSKALKIDRREK